MIGTGTFGSRSTACAGTAMLMAADKIIAKGTRLAAHMLEAGEHDIEFKNGRFAVAGTDKSVDLAAVARDAFVPAKLPKGMEPGLYETGTFDGGQRTYPNGCHISEVEIDAATGEVTLVRYTAVDDVGHMVNPMLVEGQLHGGVAMGVGQALLENMVYDGAGQVVSGSFMDYAMPRAHDFCDFRLGENEVPTKTQPARRQGRGRVRHGRRAAVGDERDQRRAGADRRRRTCRCRRRRRRSGGRSRRREKRRVGKIACAALTRGQRRIGDFAHAEMPRNAPLPTLRRTGYNERNQEPPPCPDTRATSRTASSRRCCCRSTTTCRSTRRASAATCATSRP